MVWVDIMHVVTLAIQICGLIIQFYFIHKAYKEYERASETRKATERIWSEWDSLVKHAQSEWDEPS